MMSTPFRSHKSKRTSRSHKKKTDRGLPPLRIAVLGPTGQCGSCIVDELLYRGHDVVGVSRNPPEAWKEGENSAHRGVYESVAVDVRDEGMLRDVFSSGFDAIVCAFAPGIRDLKSVYENGVEGHGRVKRALLRSSHSGSFIIIGGAGSLHTMNRRQLVDETGFAYSWWYIWPDEHFNYMRVRARAHGNFFFSLFIAGFRWARNNVEHPGWFSWLFRPIAWTYLFLAKRKLTSPQTRSLITSTRTALTMWEGVREKKWTFLSPPGQLRDQGVRTGRYKIFIDSEEDPAVEAVDGAIYNEDLAVAVADEIEGPRMTFLHWSVVGRVGLAAW